MPDANPEVKVRPWTNCRATQANRPVWEEKRCVDKDRLNGIKNISSRLRVWILTMRLRRGGKGQKADCRCQVLENLLLMEWCERQREIARVREAQGGMSHKWLRVSGWRDNAPCSCAPARGFLREQNGLKQMKRSQKPSDETSLQAARILRLWHN